ncbi:MULTISPECIES: GGDEF domain-containing protein [Marinobacter]|uniref:GGDEF domain-containing protein n=1 Tax=Marinobacter TaxID=2742 RepID=UPI000DADE094|nr:MULTISPECIES: GGDEF domain-containing protein [Marinobacter]
MPVSQAYRLRPKPASVRIENYRKYAVLHNTALVATVLHAGLIFLFGLIGSTVLALFNVASVAAWLLAWWLNRRGRHGQAIYVMCLETAGHAFLAVSILGADSGFHFYLWPVACLAIMNPRLLPRQAAVIGYTCIALFAYLQLRYGGVPYRYAFADYVPLLYFINVMTAAFPLVLAMVMVRTTKEAQEYQLMEMATRDPLTGLYNRRFANEFLGQTFAGHDRQDRAFCIALGDIDRFRDVNDRHGHEIGDEVLETIAMTLLGTFRRSDCLCRWGGDEFMIAFPETSEDTALAALERFRTALQRQRVRRQEQSVSVTLSFGLVTAAPGESAEECIHRADDMLYHAKRAGGDRTVTPARAAEPSLQDSPG